MLIAILVMFVLLMSFLVFVSFVNRNGEDLEFISNQGKDEKGVEHSFGVGSILIGLEFTKLDGTNRHMDMFHVKDILVRRNGKTWVIGLEDGLKQKSFYLDRVVKIRDIWY
jgi:hypothetical protein